MIILDTNVVSELMKPSIQRSQAVFDWAASQPGERLFTTTITVAEILAGLANMPDGKRRAAKEEAADSVLALFQGRILVFDVPAARHFADAVTRRRRSGKSIGSFDMLIGAIARSNGMAVATRNVDDFDNIGIELISPWIV